MRTGLGAIEKCRTRLTFAAFAVDHAVIGHVLRECRFHALEALVSSPARRDLSLLIPFSEDTLSYLTDRLNPHRAR